MNTRVLKQLGYLVILFVVLFGATIGFERMFSPNFQSCIEDNLQNKASTPYEEYPARFGILFASYARCTGLFMDHNGSGVTALATIIIIAAFTGILWYTTIKQAQFSEFALVYDKRAIISADTFMQFYEFDAATNTYSWRLRPRWRNTGGTSSKNLTTHVECEIRDTMLPEGYAFNYSRDDVGKGLIPAKAEIMGGLAPQAAPITAQDIADSQIGKRFIYLWGVARYFDVFPDTPERVFHFCWLVVAVGNPLTFQPNVPGHTLTFSLIQNKEGNYET